MRDDFDFDDGAFGQSGDLNRGTGREIVREIFRVDFVHAREVGEVRQEHGAFDDVREGKFLILQNGFYVFQDAFGLRFDIAGNEVSGGRIKRDLPRAKE